MEKPAKNQRPPTAAPTTKGPAGGPVLAKCVEAISALEESDRKRVLAALQTYFGPGRITR